MISQLAEEGQDDFAWCGAASTNRPTFIYFYHRIRIQASGPDSHTKDAQLSRLLQAVVFGLTLWAAIVLSRAGKADGDQTAAIYPGNHTVVYSVGDLPVWTVWSRTPTAKDNSASFSPSLLSTHIQTVVDPPSWRSTGRILPLPKDSCPAITQSGKNHHSISKILDRLLDQADARMTAVLRAAQASR
jgi:hypothetical protein